MMTSEIDLREIKDLQPAVINCCHVYFLRCPRPALSFCFFPTSPGWSLTRGYSKKAILFISVGKIPLVEGEGADGLGSELLAVSDSASEEE
ncbi:hypothetical protein FKM82_024235 [Ascaphus truei]